MIATAGSAACAQFITGSVPYADLDAAATTPALAVVAEAVEQLLPLYSSVHRGAGWKSQITSAAFEGARQSVHDFAGAGTDHEVVFVRGTTEAANLLSASLREGSVVLSSAHEHHANLLPWARHQLRILPLTRSADDWLDRVEQALRDHGGRVALVAVTGASNVSGEVFPVAEVTALAHSHGAQVFVDAAQLAPHRPLDVAGWDVDFLAFSGHKLYAPFGSGVLVGRRGLLDRSSPWLRGGGASHNVTRRRVEWAAGAARHEAGSPNVVGAVALGVACDALTEIGMDAVTAHERELAEALSVGLSQLDGVTRHELWADHPDRVGVAAFTALGWRPCDLAAILASDYGIGVRSGRFCAHQLVDALTGTTSGATRASIGLHTSRDDVDALIDALTQILSDDALDRGHGESPVRWPEPVCFRLAWPTGP